VNRLGAQNVCTLQWLSKAINLLISKQILVAAKCLQVKIFTFVSRELHLNIKIAKHFPDVINDKLQMLDSCRQTKLFFPSLDVIEHEYNELSMLRSLATWKAPILLIFQTLTH
jgi:branched-subunit amino acid transport protein